MLEIVTSIFLLMLSIPGNFSKATTKIQKSSSFTNENIPFISSLNLSHIISISCQVPSIPSVHLISFNNHPNSWKPIDDGIVKAVIQFLLVNSNLPLLVCDISGEAAIIFAILRRLQGWDLVSVLSEYQTTGKSKYTHEVYIEQYDLDLIVIPEGSWLIQK